MDEKIKTILEKFDALEKSIKASKETIKEKDQIIDRLDTDVRVLRELGIAAQKDPVLVENLITALADFNKKDFFFKGALEVSNFKDVLDKLEALIGKEQLPYPTKIEVTNLGDIKPEKEVKVSNLGDLGKLFTTGFTKAIDAIVGLGSKAFNAVVTGEVRITNKEIQDAIPVRLASKDLRFFYDALTTVMGSGGGSSDQTLLQQIIDAINALGGDWYDLISITYPAGDTEVYTYSLGGVTVQTITVVYTDATKVDLLSVTKT